MSPMNERTINTVAEMLCKLLPDTQDQADMLNLLLCSDDRLTDNEDAARLMLFDCLTVVCNPDAVQCAQES